MSEGVEERIVVNAPPEAVYAAVADVRRIARWSPECFAVWVYRRRAGAPARFVGWNRRKGYIWFTTCRVVRAEPSVEFTFDVTTFGMPVSRWSYRFVPVADGTEVTEAWTDARTGGSLLLGKIFTGRRAAVNRPDLNRTNMRTTLDRLKRELEP